MFGCRPTCDAAAHRKELHKTTTQERTKATARPLDRDLRLRQHIKISNYLLPSERFYGTARKTCYV